MSRLHALELIQAGTGVAARLQPSSLPATKGLGFFQASFLAIDSPKRGGEGGHDTV